MASRVTDSAAPEAGYHSACTSASLRLTVATTAVDTVGNRGADALRLTLRR